MTVRLMRRSNSGGPVAAWSVAVEAAQSSPTPATGSVSVNTDGTISGTNASGDAEWHRPAAGSPGTRYWIKYTLDSGSAWNAGLTAGTVYALTSNRSVTWSVTGGAKSAGVTASIYADSGGTLLVGTGSISVNVESS